MFFVFHGSLDNNKSIGTNTMIKQGAKLVDSANDIIENYPFLIKAKQHKKAKPIIKKTVNYNLDEIEDEYKDIYKILINSPCNIETIAKLTNTSIHEVLPKIAMLEIEGKIKKTGGNKYKLC